MDAELAVSVMLLGSISFVFSLFYFLNARDEDLRKYYWNVLSSSICTFMGVRLATAWNMCFSYYVLPSDASKAAMILTNFNLMVGWYLVLQCVLALVCGIIGDWKPKDERDMLLNLKCWAVMLGVVTGGSSMTFWSALQNYVDSPLAIYAMPAIAMLLMWLTYAAFDKLRELLSLADDGSTDDHEKVWDAYVDQTENNVLALTTSHLVVQATRYRLTGSLPLPTGAMRPGTVVTHGDILGLYAASALFTALIVILEFAWPRKWALLHARLKGILANAVAFTLLYSTTWLVTEQSALSGPSLAMVIALAVTWSGFAIIFALDFMADLEWTGERFDANLRLMVIPVSTFIGFGWKGAFVAAGASVVAHQDSVTPPAGQLLLAFGLLSVILPAWRMHILPVVMHHELEQVSAAAAKEGSMLSQSLLKKDSLLEVEKNAAFDQMEIDIESMLERVEQELAMFDASGAPDGFERLARISSRLGGLSTSAAQQWQKSAGTNKAMKEKVRFKGTWCISPR